MGLTTPDGTTYYVHPTFLYESLWNLVGFIIIDRYWYRKDHRNTTVRYSFSTSSGTAPAAPAWRA